MGVSIANTEYYPLLHRKGETFYMHDHRCRSLLNLKKDSLRQCVVSFSYQYICHIKRVSNTIVYE